MPRQFLPFFLALPLLFTCIFHKPTSSQTNHGPYTDTIGYRAARARIENIGRVPGEAMIAQALRVPENQAEHTDQPEFFKSIEDSYQRYLKLFTRTKKAPRPEIRCAYDLVETFKLQVFDPQPFVNAILHTLSLTDLSTLDFTIRPQSTDTLLVLVSWARAESQQTAKEISISEGDLTIEVTRHTAVLATPFTRPHSSIHRSLLRENEAG